MTKQMNGLDDEHTVVVVVAQDKQTDSPFLGVKFHTIRTHLTNHFKSRLMKYLYTSDLNVRFYENGIQNKNCCKFSDGPD